MDDPDPLLWQLLLQLLLIAINAVFACAEIAVISISESKLEKLSQMSGKQSKQAKRLLSLTSNPAKFLATIQIGVTLAGFLGSAFAADNFAGKLAGWFVSLGFNASLSALTSVSVIIITLVLAFVTLVLGELVPKRIAMQKAEAIGLAMSGVVFSLSKIFAPVVWLLTVSTNGVLRIFRIDPKSEGAVITEEEIRMMVDVGNEKGSIDSDEREFIHNLFEFDNKTAAELMTHRTDVIFLWLEESSEIWDKTIDESRFSKYPVCGDDGDDIIGVLYANNYFRLSDKSRESVMEKAVKPAQFVPETVRADVLLANMKKNRNHFAVVLDEYGGMSGIISIDDLLEELVGDLNDDITAPEETPPVELLDENLWRINGAALLEDVAETIGVPLPCDDYDTFAGMVFAFLGTIPDDGSTLELEAYGLDINITEIREHRLEKATVRIMPAETASVTDG